MGHVTFTYEIVSMFKIINYAIRSFLYEYVHTRARRINLNENQKIKFMRLVKHIDPMFWEAFESHFKEASQLNVACLMCSETGCDHWISCVWEVHRQSDCKNLSTAAWSLQQHWGK